MTHEIQDPDLLAEVDTTQNFIELDQDDITSNFTIIPNALIRDKNLSPDCCYLIIFLLSNRRDWRINTAQLTKVFKGRMGREKLYNLLREAIEAGYINREITKNGNRYDGFKYTVASTPKFKKCLPHTGFQEAGIQDVENQHTKEDYLERKPSIRNKTSLKVPKEPDKPKPEISKEAKQLGDWMKEAIKQTAPDVNFNFKEDLYISCDSLIKKSGWTAKQLYEVFIKGLKSDFWKAHLLKANPAHYLSFKDRYVTIREQNNKSEPQRKFAAASTHESEMEIAKKMRQGAL